MKAPTSVIAKAIAAKWTAAGLETSVGPLRLQQAPEGSTENPYAILDLNAGFRREFRSTNADGHPNKIRVGYRGTVMLLVFADGGAKKAEECAERIVEAMPEPEPGFTLIDGAELLDWKLVTDTHILEGADKDGWPLQFEAFLAIVSTKGGQAA